MRSQWSSLVLLIVLIGAALIVIAGLLPVAYTQPWTGLGSYTTPKNSTADYHPAKTLWDWMELFVVPLFLAIGALLFNWVARNREMATAQERTKSEQAIAQDNRREAALQTYLDRMSDLLLREGLGDAIPNPEEPPLDLSARRVVARARTLTVLRGLDAQRKGAVLRFLYESNLIEKEGAKVALDGADLREANLSETNLSEANLRGANLRTANLRAAVLSKANVTQANLHGADLRAADLRAAILSSTDLSAADLRGANLSGGVLPQADLSAADLQGAVLTEAYVLRANLRGADLRGAYVIRANLSEADLSGADLSGADLQGAELSGARYSRNTKWPDRFDSGATRAVPISE